MTMRSIACGLLFPAVLMWSVNNAAAQVHLKTGNDLYQDCSSGMETPISTCLGYLMGVYDSLSALNLACPPADVSSTQLKDIVMDYLRSHPETRHESGAIQAGLAVEQTFRCK